MKCPYCRFYIFKVSLKKHIETCIVKNIIDKLNYNLKKLKQKLKNMKFCPKCKHNLNSRNYCLICRKTIK